MADDTEIEFVPEEDSGALYPDTLAFDEGQVFFYPDLGTFCEQHNAKAVMVKGGQVFLLPKDGGAWYDVEAHGKGATWKLRPV